MTRVCVCVCVCVAASAASCGGCRESQAGDDAGTERHHWRKWTSRIVELVVRMTPGHRDWEVYTVGCKNMPLLVQKSKNLPRNTGLVVQNKVACFYGPCMVYSRIADNMIEVHRERFWWLVQAYAYCIGCTSILHCLGLLSLPSCVARTVKWIYDFELSSNNKWRWWMWTVAVPADSQPE